MKMVKAKVGGVWGVVKACATLELLNFYPLDFRVDARCVLPTNRYGRGDFTLPRMVLILKSSCFSSKLPHARNLRTSTPQRSPS